MAIQIAVEAGQLPTRGVEVITCLRGLMIVGPAFVSVPAIRVGTVVEVGLAFICLTPSGGMIESVFAPVEAVFPVHEELGVFRNLLTNRRMILQVGLQSRMVLHKLGVVDQRRIRVQLFGNFAVVVEKLIEAGKFPTRDVVGPRWWIVL